MVPDILLPQERIVPVNAIVRLLGLEFSNRSSVDRQTRSATAAGTSLHFLDEDSHNLVEAACWHEEGQEVATENETEGEAGEAMDHEEAE